MVSCGAGAETEAPTEEPTEEVDSAATQDEADTTATEVDTTAAPATEEETGH